eukprot:gb/GFBE01079925.1/.p1 GENE.gb/GFBE01079925.1/~~gb/GFBE01079925.1/.p1  ORF type:complete len:728 (+),score=179.72 gb/GFBE01079925.1/:1-2184(+)
MRGKKSTSGAGGASGGGYFAKEEEDKKLKELEEKLNRKISGLENVIKDDFGTQVTSLKEQLETVVKQSKEDAMKKAEEDLSSQMEAMRQELAKKMQETADRINDVDTAAKANLSSVNAEVTAVSDAAQSKREELAAELRESIAIATREAQQAAENTAREDAQGVLNELEKQADVLRKEMSLVAPPIFARCESLQGSLDGLSAELGRSMAEAERTVGQLTELVETTRRAMEESIADCLHRSALASQETARSVEALSRMVNENETSLRKAALLSENVHCRSMVWKCSSFHKRLVRVVQSEASVENPGIRSPDFSLCSLPELQLELSLAARSVAGDADAAPRPPLPGAAPAAPSPPLPVPGSCTFRLWGPPGLHMTFRVTLGDGPSAVTRRFEHTFAQQAEECLGKDSRTCFEVLNFCQLDQVWVRSEDLVQVSFEILEFKMLPVLCTWGASAPKALTAAPEEAQDALDTEAHDTTAGWPPKPTSGDVDLMLFTRSATAEMLVHERLQKDMLTLKNKSVRRVEWRVEGCSRLLELSRVGEGFDSPIFSAAGQERLQFHFYPRGHEVAGSGGTQPCGLFISGPGRGVTLKGMMWVGGNNRGLEHRFQRKGDLGGRPRFCPLESQLDCDDTVVIALDIHEVEQELPDHGALLVLREARAGALNDGSANHGLSKMSTTSSAPTGVKGLMRMRREDPSKTEELVKCVSLPTLNARTMSQMSIGMASKSRRSFDF